MKCAFCDEPAWYRCPHTEEYICARHATVQVVAWNAKREPEPSIVRAAGEQDNARLQELAIHFWGETEVECFDREYDVLTLPAFVGLKNDHAVGFVSYSVEEDTMNLVMLNVLPEHQGRGLGSALLAKAVLEARELGLSRLVVATSNDDVPALYYYQRSGFQIEEVVPGRIAEHHGGLEEGFAGISVRDEIRMQLVLKDTSP
jgi:ribosomal protein S18 acetylase RimI-like enzyme